jgi:hypothetical protein
MEMVTVMMMVRVVGVMEIQKQKLRLPSLDY